MDHFQTKLQPFRLLGRARQKGLDLDRIRPVAWELSTPTMIPAHQHVPVMSSKAKNNTICYYRNKSEEEYSSWSVILIFMSLKTAAGHRIVT